MKTVETPDMIKTPATIEKGSEEMLYDISHRDHFRHRRALPASFNPNAQEFEPTN